MHRGKDHNEIAEIDGFAIRANKTMKLPERLPTNNHVDYINSNAHDQLLRHQDPKPKLFSKDMLCQLVIPIKPLTRLAWAMEPRDTNQEQKYQPVVAETAIPLNNKYKNIDSGYRSWHAHQGESNSILLEK